MSRPNERDVAEALAALQRLSQHGVIALEDAREAARLISGDEGYEFPPPAASATEDADAAGSPSPPP